MKILIISVLVLAFTAPSIQKQEIKQIEFSKISRGYEEHVRISADSVNILVHDIKMDKPAMSVSRATEKEEWTRLITDLKNVKVEALESLPSPTMNRASDAALHGTITISTSGEKSFSHGFDDENPHDALKPLMKTIKEIANTAKSK